MIMALWLYPEKKESLSLGSYTEVICGWNEGISENDSE